MYRTRTITIDIDYSKSDRYIDISIYRFLYICKSKDVEKCSMCLTENGIHLYIVLKKDIGYWDMIMLRSILLDDNNRIDFDMDREVYPQVMFKDKYVVRDTYRKKISFERICYFLNR